MKDFEEKLKLFEERLDSYTTEEFLEMLKPWEKITPPTVEEFIASMETDVELDALIAKNISDLYEE